MTTLYADNVVDQYNRPVLGAAVTVWAQDRSALATLTTSGGAPLANPVTTDADGAFSFYAVDGVYSLDIAYGGRLRYRDQVIQVGVGIPLPDSVLLQLAANGGAALVGTSTGNSVQAELDAGDAAVASLQTQLTSLSRQSPARARQLLATNLYLMNNAVGGINIIGDSISHGAYSGNAYTNHWSYLLARSVAAAFDTRSLGFFPLDGLYNSIPALETPQLVDLTMSAGWGATEANPAPYNYPIGDIGANAADIINGKAYSSTTSGATMTITLPSICERVVLLFTKQPGGGVFNITVNGSAAGTINTANATTLYNQGQSINVVDNGKGECVIVLTKADTGPTQINATAGLLSSDIGIADFSKRIAVHNYSQKGRLLSNMSEANVIRACNAPALIMALGYNDWGTNDADNNDTNFNAFKQRITFAKSYG